MGFFRNVSGLLATSTVTTTAAMATSVILARFLTPDDRGLFAVALSFAGISAILIKLGMPSASIYRMKRARVPARTVVSTGVFAMLGVSALFLLAATAAGPWIRERFLDDAPAIVLWIAMAIVPMQLLRGIFTSSARGINRFDVPNVNGALLTVTTTSVMAVVLIGLGGSLVAALCVALATQAAFTLALGAQLVSLTGFAPRPDLGELRESLRFGMKSYAQALAGQVHERIDIFMLAYFLGDPAQVAFYAVAAGVIERLKTVPEAISAAAFPQLAGYDRERAADFACRVSRQATLWGLVTAVGLGGAAPLLIPLLYGDPYRASVLPFLVLLPGMALLTLYRVLSRYFMALDQQQANIATQSISVAVNIALNLWWIPRYGVLGAAMASLASYSLEAILITIVFMRSSGRGLRETFVPRRNDLAEYRRRLAPFLRRLRIPGAGPS